ncbi:MAG: P-II family nitrogen regulator [Pseudomonadales bacterium]
MNAREVNAYVDRSRIGDVVDALAKAGFVILSVTEIEKLLKPLTHHAQGHATEPGDHANGAVKLELVCDTENRTAEAVALIREHAKTGQASAGWVYVTEVHALLEITS